LPTSRANKRSFFCQAVLQRAVALSPPLLKRLHHFVQIANWDCSS